MKLYNDFIDGIQMTHDILAKVLKKYGIAEYSPLGEKFDPNRHEAVFEYMDPSKKPGTVGQMMTSGYTIGKRILRAPKVGVIKKAPAQESAASNGK